MGLVRHKIGNSVVTLTIDRPKVNAINDDLIRELHGWFDKLAGDPNARAVILTGEGSFFSFGLDVPGYMGYTKEEFLDSFTGFCDLYALMFEFPKPLIAAINGHAVGAGCILALACDWRLMAAGKPKIGLNEITFASTLPAGSVEMLKFAVGETRAARVVYTGRLFSADEALSLGLVDEVVEREELLVKAREAAEMLAKPDASAFESMKLLLKGHAIEEMRRREEASISNFVELWYSEPVRAGLEKIEIR